MPAWILLSAEVAPGNASRWLQRAPPTGEQAGQGGVLG
jgi:hypothetical protein